MPSLRMVVPAEVAATLRGLRLVDTAGERLVFRARLAGDTDGAVLAAGEDDLEELLGYVAAEANHEKDRRHQKRLDQAFRALNDVVDQPGRIRRSRRAGPAGRPRQRRRQGQLHRLPPCRGELMRLALRHAAAKVAARLDRVSIVEQGLTNHATIASALAERSSGQGVFHFPFPH